MLYTLALAAYSVKDDRSINEKAATHAAFLRAKYPRGHATADHQQLSALLRKW
jgi:hypothetical protein